MNNWYARFPILIDNNIYFIAGNDLFTVHKNGGTPQLCFNASNELKNLYAYKNKIAMTSFEHGGPDIYLFDVETYEFQRVTYFERNIKTTFMNDEYIEFLSNKDSAFKNDQFLYRYYFKTKECVALNIGPIEWAFVNNGEYIFQKNEHGYISFKGYKGGTAGQIWNKEKNIINLPGNCLRPCIYDFTIFFLYDDGKHGNIYSCSLDGTNLKQITFYNDFYIQDLSLHKNELIYTSGGKIAIYDIKTNKESKPLLSKSMNHPKSKPFNTSSHKHITSIDSDGTKVQIAIRGHVLSAHIFSGGTITLTNDIRYRVSGFLGKNKSFAFKEPPHSQLVIYENDIEIKKFSIETGKINFTKAAMNKPYLAFINHKHELHLFNYETGEDKVIFKAYNKLNECDFSANGRYIVYCASFNVTQSCIRIYDIETDNHYDITNKDFYAFSPSFDINGEFIVFLSNQHIECLNDGLRFDKMFSSHKMPYLIPLQKNKQLLMPWQNSEENIDEINEDNKEEKSKEAKDIKIDFENIQSRIIPMPVQEKNYIETHAVENSKILLVYTSDAHLDEEEELGEINVETFCLKTLELNDCYNNISYFDLCFDKKNCIIEDSAGVKILKTGQKEEKKGYKNSGIFNLSRMQCTINPQQEWKQMIEELWWIIKEFFWSPKMAGVDWNAIWQKYKNSTNNIRTRAELDDLINEIQGEVGTSHAFIWNAPKHISKKGYLGCNFKLNSDKNEYTISEIFEASLQDKFISPIKTGNYDIKPGDVIKKIDGKEINANYSPYQALANKSSSWLTLETQDKKIDIKAVGDQTTLLYRKWVNDNRNFVKKHNSKLGYIHIPDMINNGFKEFYQSYLNEYDQDCIIIDIRYNRGGNVSTLIIDQLKRARLGLDSTRHHGIHPIPHESSKGNFVLLINEHTCSDGEIFAEMFKMLEMGTIIGKRTWGGVIGIMPRYKLIDGTLTSQPEFGTFLKNTKYNTENNGVSPDIEIFNDHMKPFCQENDLQLIKAIEVAASNIKKDELMQMLQETEHTIK